MDRRKGSMAERLPDHILQDAVLSRLPNRSLLRLRCVSRSWLSSIDRVIEVRKRRRMVLCRTIDRRVGEGNCKRLILKVLDEKFDVIKNFSVISPEPFYFSDSCPVQSCEGLVYLGHSFGIALVCHPLTEELITLPRVDGSATQCFGIGFDSSKYVFVRLCELKCQMLVLGDNRWRDIKSRPPFLAGNCAPFVHGSFHFLPRHAAPIPDQDFIATFQLLTEDFQRITFPPAYFSMPGIRSIADLGGSLSFCHTIGLGTTDATLEIYLLIDYFNKVWDKQYRILLCKLTEEPSLPYYPGAPADPTALLGDGHLVIFVTAVEDTSNKLVLYNNRDNGVTRHIVETHCSSISFAECLVPLHELIKASNASVPRGINNTAQDSGVGNQIQGNTGSLILDKSATVNKGQSVASSMREKCASLDKETGYLNQLNLAIVGHAGSGKSTLSRRLMHLVGQMPKSLVLKGERETEEKRVESFSHVTDMVKTVEEWRRNSPMALDIGHLKTNKYRVVLLDCPGHRDSVPSLISGATQADGAILVVDASTGSFEDGNLVEQTRDNAYILKLVSMNHIIVAISKMDTVNYSKRRFEFIKGQLETSMNVWFEASTITWIPVSAIKNQNLATNSHACLSSWYEGPCLLDAIDSLEPPLRDLSKPLCLPISDVIKSNSGQLSALGKIEFGTVSNFSKVLVLPAGAIATVQSMDQDKHSCNIARAGDNVVVWLEGIDSEYLMPGGVVCHPDFPVAMSNRLLIEIVACDSTTPIAIGLQADLYIHQAREAATIVAILPRQDPKGGEATCRNVVEPTEKAIIEVALDGAVCVEESESSNSRALGRVVLRASGLTIAIGWVKRVMKKA